MQFRVETVTFDKACEMAPLDQPGDGYSVPPRKWNGKWQEGESAVEPAKLPYREWLEGIDTVIMTEHTHDGTSTFTELAIAVVTKAAESFAEKSGGDWETSHVRITHLDNAKPVNGMPSHLFLKEVVAICMRRRAA